MSVTGAPVGGANLVAVGFELRDFTRTYFSNDAIPLSFDLSKFQQKKLNLVFWDGTKFIEFFTDVTALALINSVAGLNVADPVTAPIPANPVTTPAIVISPRLLPLLSDGSPRNVVNVAAGIDNAVANGATVPSSFTPLYLLSGTALKDVLPQLTGEAATGARQGAFQLTSQFLDVMLDPFVLGSGGMGRGSALGFATEREGLPQDASLAYANAAKVPV